MAELNRLVHNLTEQVQRRNREIVGDALLKAGLGLLFTVFVAGFLFWFWWLLELYFGSLMGLRAWAFSLIATFALLAVAFWSAWRRVNPLAGVGRMTEQQLLLTALSQASGSVLQLSPEHASVGAAALLLGGLSNLIESLAMWRHRLPTNPQLVMEAAEMLNAAGGGLSMKKIREPQPAILLRRLALIKAVPRGDSSDIVLTERGQKLVGEKVK